MRFRFYAFLLFFLLGLPLPAHAQDQADSSLHVLKPSIDVEQDAAEICLEFDHALDLSDRTKIATNLHLTMDGKTVGNLATNINASGDVLCIEGLEHRRKYDLALANLRGAKGEKLPGAYALSFTVPDRKPTLAFAGDSDVPSLPRYKDSDPLLRAINIARVRIELYRLADPAAGADAWRQRLQASLAPSESLTFARSKGQLVWRGTMMLDNGDDESLANRTIEKVIPLRAAAGTLEPGLYFIVAATELTAKAKKEMGADALAPLAGQWFLRSDLKVRAFSSHDGIYAETEDAGGTKALKGVHLLVSDANGQTLAEGESDADGVAFLPLAADKRAAANMLTGTTAGGDSDFTDFTNMPDEFSPADLDPSLSLDRPFYPPGSTVSVALGLRDIHAAAVNTTGSTLILLRPDEGFYQSVPVPALEAGIAYVSFPAPALEGKWSLVWQRSDGRKLIMANLRVTSNKAAPHLEVTADRPSLGSDGEVNLTLKSVTNDGHPAPYIAGQISLRWHASATLSGWNGYSFGTGTDGNDVPIPVANFITDGGGTAPLHLVLKIPEDHLALHTAEIQVETDPATGAAAADPLSLPVQNDHFAIGLKPLALEAKFAENSLARFDVVALDGNGKSQSLDGLSYQIYEEGRQFAWYQANGRWDYKPEQQRRRIGGGALLIKPNGTLLSWPVTAGSYTLEIADTNGAILARAHAEAGWDLSRPSPTASSELILKPQAFSAQMDTPFKIGFTLDKPAMVSALIADDRIRKVIHEALPAGDNAITFTPGDDWGAKIGVWIEAQNGTLILSGGTILSISQSRKELAITAMAPASVTAGQELVLPLTVANISSQSPTVIDVLATPEPETNAELFPDSQVITGVTVDHDGKAVLHLSTPIFSGTVRLEIAAANADQKGHQELLVPVHSPLTADLSLPSFLHANDTLPVTLTLRNNEGTPEVFHYTVNTTPGLSLSGLAHDNVTLAPDKPKSITFNLRALRAGEQNFRLEIAGPHNVHDGRGWSVAVLNPLQEVEEDSNQTVPSQQNWILPAPTDPHASSDAHYLFVSGEPLLDLPKLLQMLVQTEPFTTGEMAAWLEATRLWNDVIIKSGILPSEALHAEREQILFRLMRRQMADGAFPDLPGSGDNVASTGQALVALTEANQPVAYPAAARAASWLHDKLQNSWFEEKERPERASAFAALATANSLDIATLRYFAETSAGKDLPSLAAAQLAAALMKSGDNDKTRAWLKIAREAQAPKEPAPLALLATLSTVSLIDPRDLLPDTQKREDDLIKHHTRDLSALADLLRVLYALNDRTTTWRATIDNQEQSQKGVLVIPVPAKYAPLTVHNSMDGPLFVVEGTPVVSPLQNTDIRRRIFRPDGTEVTGDTLSRGGIYVISLEGGSPEAKEGDQSYFIQDLPGEGLRRMGCAINNGVSATGSWAWLQNATLTSAPICEPTRHGIDTILAASGAASWHIAYLAEAERPGSYVSAATSLRVNPRQDWIAGTMPGAINIK